MRYLFLALILVISTCLPCIAQEEDYHVLYSLHADVDGDKVDERILMLSTSSGDPTANAPKEFWIMKRRGDKYRRVFKAGPNDGEFTNQMMLWQLEGPDNLPPGISLMKGQGLYPLIRVVFAPGSDYLVDFQFNGKEFQDVTVTPEF
jgi:hypothetical protein